MHGEGGALNASSCGFCLLLKKSTGNPYLKILDFYKLFIADAPVKKNNSNEIEIVKSAEEKHLSDICKCLGFNVYLNYFMF